MSNSRKKPISPAKSCPKPCHRRCKTSRTILPHPLHSRVVQLDQLYIFHRDIGFIPDIRILFLDTICSFFGVSPAGVLRFGNIYRHSCCFIFDIKASRSSGYINEKGEKVGFVDLHVILCLAPVFPYFPPVGTPVLLFLPRVSSVLAKNNNRHNASLLSPVGLETYNFLVKACQLRLTQSHRRLACTRRRSL